MKVLIVEDSAAVRENLEAMLSGISGVAVVGHAEGEAEAIELIDTLLPDVVILDLGLQQGTGLNVLSSVKRRHSAIKVIVLSNFSSDLYVHWCRRAGADYFFDKSFQFLMVGAALKHLVSPGELNERVAALRQ